MKSFIPDSATLMVIEPADVGVNVVLLLLAFVKVPFPLVTLHCTVGVPVPPLLLHKVLRSLYAAVELVL